MISAKEARELSESADYIENLLEKIDKGIYKSAKTGHRYVMSYYRITLAGFEKIRNVLEPLGYKITPSMAASRLYG